MIKLDGGYSDYVATNDPKYPAGKAVDASSEEGVDGTPILARLINDINGFRQALFSAAFGDFSTLSNEPDNAQKSDTLNAINKITQDYTNNKVEAEAIERVRVDRENLDLANSFTSRSVETEAQARTQGDVGTMNSAKSYADDKVAVEEQERVRGDSNTLNSAKQYTSQKFMSANGVICTTAAGVQDKVVLLEEFVLFEGAVVRVLFSNGSAVANPTLNVNNTGAKPIKVYRNGEKIALPVHQKCNNPAASSPTYTTVSVDKGVILELFYDGSAWLVMGNPDVMTGLGENYGYTVKANGLLVQTLRIRNRTANAHNYFLAFSSFCFPFICVLENETEYAHTAHITAYSTHDIRVVTRWTNENNSGGETTDIIIFALGF
ncbi:MAG: hypothetical protein ACTTKC_05090 [Treponema sp.]|uniref:hypothetical protein n=1 Tax=Treponema sp. TaxID=166 RepID=UPI003FA22F1C